MTSFWRRGDFLEWLSWSPGTTTQSGGRATALQIRGRRLRSGSQCGGAVAAGGHEEEFFVFVEAIGLREIPDGA